MDPNIPPQPVQPAAPGVQTPTAQINQPAQPISPVAQNSTPQAPMGQNTQPIQQTIPNKPSRATYRISAVIIDGSIILGLWSLLSLLLVFLLNIHILIKDANNSPLIMGYYLVGVIVQIIYFVYFHAHDGATPGKKLFGLRVIDLKSSSNLSYSKSISRELIKFGIVIIPIIGGLLDLLNVLLVVFSKTKQGIHDSVVKSQVIEVGKPVALWKQVLLYVLLLSFWGVSTLILVAFVFGIGNGK